MQQITERGGDAHFELSFSPNVRLITSVRKFVGDFYERVLGDPDVTSRLVVATHELLENAVRYSVDGKSSIRIGVVRDGDGVLVSIDTENRTNQTHTSELEALLAEMRASTDRASLYQTLLARSALREHGSGLGLGRIHAESEMDLTCDLQDGVVKMRASARFRSKTPAWASCSAFNVAVGA
jgi:anti-sigma regulatory factor (Ser/Thr protein kinase)